MFKKIILTTSLCLSVLQSVEAKPSSNFYAGAAAGYVYLTPYGSATETSGEPGSVTRSINLNKRASGIEGKIFGGYDSKDICCSGLSLGGDAFVSVNNAHSRKVLSITGSDKRTNIISQRYTVGAYFNAGGNLTKTVSLYGKLGVVNSRFVVKHQTTASSGYGAKAQEHNLWGISPGFEVRKDLSNLWRLNFEGTFTWYQSWKSKDFDPSSPGSAFTNIRPRVLSLSVGIARKF